MTDGTHNSDYEEGMRDGRLDALSHRVAATEVKSANHERRLIYLERIVWGVFGILFLSTALPRLEGLLNALSK